jgi:hypothetical protein
LALYQVVLPPGHPITSFMSKHYFAMKKFDPDWANYHTSTPGQAGLKGVYHLAWLMDCLAISPYWPTPWTTFFPQFASKMSTYVYREVSLITDFPRTYVCTMYCENSVWANGGSLMLHTLKWRGYLLSGVPPFFV